jgi:glycosyltransferase involved in cell wall biosynthesis
MRALIVLAQPPSPEGGAAARCAVGLLRGLRSHGVSVVALAARHPFSVPGPIPDDLDVEIVPVDGARTRPLLSPLTRWLRPLGDLASSAMAVRIEELGRHVDVVHFDQIESAGYGPSAGVPSAAHLHYRVRDNPRYGGYWTRESRHRLEMALAERHTIARYRWLIANSPFVARSMRRRDSTVATAPLSIDVPAGTRARLDGPPRLGIIGTARWPPTRAAMLRLIGRLWPAIRRRVPEAELHIAGRGTRELLEGVHAPGLMVAGEVASATAFLTRLSALIYPVARGSGMKVKVLESIAIGLPVVTTAAGAEGFERSDGIVVHDDDDAMIEAAVELLSDHRGRRERGESALRTFAQHYTPEHATEPLVALYQDMLSAT